MEIIEFEPPYGRQLQLDLCDRGGAAGEDIGPVVIVSPFGMVLNNSECAPFPGGHHPPAGFAVFPAAGRTAFLRGAGTLVEILRLRQDHAFIIVAQAGIAPDIFRDISKGLQAAPAVIGAAIRIIVIIDPPDGPDRSGKQRITVMESHRVQGGGEMIALRENVERFHAGGVVLQFQPVILQVKFKLLLLPLAELIRILRGLSQLFRDEYPAVWLYGGIDLDDLRVGQLIKKVVNRHPRYMLINDLSIREINRKKC